MDWVTTTEDRSQTVASVKNAYEILRQKPPKLTQRLSKLAQRRSGKADDSDDEAKEEEPQQEDAPVLITDADLAAFPALSKQEGVEARRARVQAYHDITAALREKHKAFCESFDEDMFEKLWHEFVMQQDPSKALHIVGTAPPAAPSISTAPCASMQGGAAQGLGAGAASSFGLPAAVLSARGVGSEADNGGMYDRLLRFLQSRKAYAALLQPKCFSGGVGAVLHSVLQQFMGPGSEDWGADDIQALYSWYADQTGTAPVQATGLTAGQSASAAAGASGSGAPGATASRPEQGAAGSKEGTEAADKRQLRQRKAAATGKGKAQPPVGPAADLFGAQKKANRQRPLVLLIQGTEQADLSVLRALTKLLLQDYSRLPVCLLLGTSTPADVLISSLSVDVCSRLCLRPFHMPPQEQRLEAFFQDVILGISGNGPLPLVLAGPPVQLLLERYNSTDGSVDSLAAALELAALEHCRGAPLAALAAAALAGAGVEVVEEAAAQLQLPSDALAALATEASPQPSTSTAADAKTSRGRPTATKAPARSASAGGPSSRGGADEATGPPSSQVRAAAAAVVDAASAWAAWRLGLVWTQRVAEATGACRHTEFQLPALYAASSSPSFLQPPPTASGSAPSSQAAQPPRNTLAAASDGRQLLARLTVSGGAVSVKSLSSPVDHARLRCLLDELLCIGEQAVQTWPSAGLIGNVTAELRQLLQDGPELSEPMATGDSPARVAVKGADAAAAAAAAAAAGSLVSPVRHALQGMKVKSPGDTTAAPAAAGQATAGSAGQEEAGLQGAGEGPRVTQAEGAPAGAAAAAGVGARKPPLLTNAARKQARAQAMLSAAGVRAPGTSGPGQSLQDASRRPSALQDRAAEFLHTALQQLLGSCPFRLPGCRAFAYCRTWELEGMLTMAPRAAVHEALLRPHVFLGGPEQDLGGESSLEDAALAYRLLLGQDVADVGQWFEEFAAEVVAQMHGHAGGGGAMSAGEEDADVVRGRGRGRGGARGRRRGRRLSPDAGPVARQGKKAGKRTQAPNSSSGPLDALDPEQAEAAALAAAARFSQAVAELQLVGICRPSKRRKGANMQRCYYPPETLI